jgi:hypothetical protein
LQYLVEYIDLSVGAVRRFSEKRAMWMLHHPRIHPVALKNPIIREIDVKLQRRKKISSAPLICPKHWAEIV